VTLFFALTLIGFRVRSFPSQKTIGCFSIEALVSPFLRSRLRSFSPPLFPDRFPYGFWRERSRGAFQSVPNPPASPALEASSLSQLIRRSTSPVRSFSACRNSPLQQLFFNLPPFLFSLSPRCYDRGSSSFTFRVRSPCPPLSFLSFLERPASSRVAAFSEKALSAALSLVSPSFYPAPARSARFGVFFPSPLFPSLPPPGFSLFKTLVPRNFRFPPTTIPLSKVSLSIRQNGSATRFLFLVRGSPFPDSLQALRGDLCPSAPLRRRDFISLIFILSHVLFSPPSFTLFPFAPCAFFLLFQQCATYNPFR